MLHGDAWLAGATCAARAGAAAAAAAVPCLLQDVLIRQAECKAVVDASQLRGSQLQFGLRLEQSRQLLSQVVELVAFFASCERSKFVDCSCAAARTRLRALLVADENR